LRRRINATRWPERETVTDDSQGVRLAVMQELARHWGTDYDWRTCEGRLNAQRGDPPPSDLSAEEKNAYEQLRNFFAKHVAYANIMATRPQTLYGLADSPVDLAAFMLDHGDGSGQPGLAELALQGHLDSALTRDDILDNMTLYWLTNTGVSAARLYRENKADFFDAKNITIPFAISVFPDELYQAPRSWAERAYPNNLIYYNTLGRGGRFAAWEQPDLFAAEMRAAFRTLR
jgi:Epoxide hydrolase N terminus